MFVYHVYTGYECAVTPMSSLSLKSSLVISLNEGQELYDYQICANITKYQILKQALARRGVYL